MLVYWLDIVGTAVFAISGVLLAGKLRMDPFGVLVLGVVVNNVKTGTPAAQIGLKKGDVIIGANQQAVKNIAELRKVLDSKPSVLALNIQRGDSTIYLLMQ